MSDPRYPKNERSIDNELICPRCSQPIGLGDGAMLEAEYVAHVVCRVTPEGRPSTAVGADVTASPGRERTVLYIEDSEASQRLVERLMQRRPGVRLLLAASGQQGLEMARQQRPDLILLDIHLPDMEGTELLPALRQDPRIGPVPVIVVSAEMEPQLPAQLLAGGAQAYLQKPLSFAEFFTAIDAVLARSRARSAGG
jgi:CheY-like chemotaxis protein